MTYREREKLLRRLCRALHLLLARDDDDHPDPWCFAFAGVAIVPAVIQLAVAARVGWGGLPPWASDWRIMGGSIVAFGILTAIGVLRGEAD